MSSILQWLKNGKVATRPPSVPGLPDPALAVNAKEAITLQAANDAAEVVISTSRKRKRGEYSRYDDETRAKIARYAIDNGIMKASRKFSADLGTKVNESTVRGIRNSYLKIKKSRGTDVITLPHSPRGAPTMLGDLDEDVQNWIRKVRMGGGVVNVRTIKAGAEAIVMKHAKHKLERCGGHIRITDDLARSVLRRMGFVKRRGTKDVKKLPMDFEEIKTEYVNKVSTVVTEHGVPDNLVINWDQTGCQMVPGGEWTMEERGSQQVTISGLDDKRQITVLLAVTKSGSMLPPQVIYAGKTDRCLPKGVNFPEDWDVTCTETHWSNEESMKRYVAKVILPYVNSVRESLPLSQCDQMAVCIFDVFKAHRSDEFMKILKENNITPLFVPAACTDKLQPLDLSVNKEYKDILKSKFHDWYTAQVLEQLESDGNENACIDTRTSVLKPVHVKWLIATHAEMELKKDVIVRGFSKAGLL